jgi:hypothetical protein
MNKNIYLICFTGFLLILVLGFSKCINPGKTSATKEASVTGASEQEPWGDTTAGIVSIDASWVMPAELFEISGITWIGDNKLGCIQDEEGVIYVYDLKARSVERKIKFAEPGDFEGIAYSGKHFYALRSDGIIYIIDPENPANSPYISTGLNKKQNCEGLCYDKTGNRLLIAIKGTDPDNETHKGIYAYDLAAGKMADAPVAIIDLADLHFDATEDKPSKRCEPSAIAVHPQSGQLYITNASNRTLLILAPYKNIQRLLKLEWNVLPKAEGITFSLRVICISAAKEERDLETV